MGTKKTRPFANGTEYSWWRSKNCDLCRKDCPFDEETMQFLTPLCDIENALAFASVSSGEVDSEIAKRANLPFLDKPSKCSEFCPVDGVDG